MVFHRALSMRWNWTTPRRSYVVGHQRTSARTAQVVATIRYCQDRRSLCVCSSTDNATWSKRDEHPAPEDITPDTSAPLAPKGAPGSDSAAKEELISTLNDVIDSLQSIGDSAGSSKSMSSPRAAAAAASAAAAAAPAPDPSTAVPYHGSNTMPPKMLIVPEVDSTSSTTTDIIWAPVARFRPKRPAARNASSSTLWECACANLFILAMQNTCSKVSLAAKLQLLRLINGLSYPSTVYVGDEPERMEMDALIDMLEMIGSPLPLESIERGWDENADTAKTFLGQWELVYTSNGPLTKTTPFSEAGKALGRLPGLGITEAGQDFRCDTSSSPTIKTGSSATVGLGPLGSWKVSVRGSVKSNEVTEGNQSRATFDELSISLADVMGFDFFGIRMPEVVVPVPKTKEGVEITSAWETTYLDSDTRITRGRTGAMFVYRKKPKK